MGKKKSIARTECPFLRCFLLAIKKRAETKRRVFLIPAKSYREFFYSIKLERRHDFAVRVSL